MRGVRARVPPVDPPLGRCSCFAQANLELAARGAFRPVLRGRDFAGLLKDPAEIGRVVVPTVGGDLFQGQAVGLQHELGSIHAHQVQIIVEPHEPFFPENTRDMVWRQAEVLRDAFPRDRTLKLLLHVQAKRLIGANRLAQVVLLRRFQQSQAGVEHGFRQQTRQRTFGVVRGQHPERGKNAVGGHIITAVNAGLQGSSGRLRVSSVTHQADADLLHAEQESEGLDVHRPIGFIPGVIGHKDGVAANGIDHFRTSTVSHLHLVTSRQRDGKTGKIRDIGEHGRGCTAIAKMHVPDPGAPKILFEFANDDPIGGERRRLRTRGRTFHGKLR
jgi:hypothetical protein